MASLCSCFSAPPQVDEGGERHSANNGAARPLAPRRPASGNERERMLRAEDLPTETLAVSRALSGRLGRYTSTPLVREPSSTGMGVNASGLASFTSWPHPSDDESSLGGGSRAFSDLAAVHALYWTPSRAFLDKAIKAEQGKSGKLASAGPSGAWGGSDPGGPASGVPSPRSRLRSEGSGAPSDALGRGGSGNVGQNVRELESRPKGEAWGGVQGIPLPNGNGAPGVPLAQPLDAGAPPPPALSTSPLADQWTPPTSAGRSGPFAHGIASGFRSGSEGLEHERGTAISNGNSLGGVAGSGPRTRDGEFLFASFTDATRSEPLPELGWSRSGGSGPPTGLAQAGFANWASEGGAVDSAMTGEVGGDIGGGGSWASGRSHPPPRAPIAKAPSIDLLTLDSPKAPSSRGTASRSFSRLFATASFRRTSSGRRVEGGDEGPDGHPQNPGMGGALSAAEPGGRRVEVVDLGLSEGGGAVGGRPARIEAAGGGAARAWAAEAPQVPAPGVAIVPPSPFDGPPLADLAAAHASLAGHASVLEKAELSRPSAMPTRAPDGRTTGATVPASPAAWLTAGVPSAEAALRARLSRLGLEMAVMVGDGNCLFRAISFNLYGVQERHSEVRRRVVERMRRKLDRYSAFMGEEPDRYLSAMSTSGVWGDELVLHAACEAFGVVISVVTSEPDHWYLQYHPRNIQPGPDTVEIFLTYIAPVHYNAIRRRSASSKLLGTLRRGESKIIGSMQRASRDPGESGRPDAVDATVVGTAVPATAVGAGGRSDFGGVRPAGVSDHGPRLEGKGAGEAVENSW